MALWYPVEGHPLLEEDALALDANQLREWAYVAERVLGLRGPNATLFTGDAALEAARAVAMQVSLLAAKDPETYFAERVGRGSEDMYYREGFVIHPLAEQIVADLYAEVEEEAAVPEPGFPIVGSRRFPSGAAGTARAEYDMAERNAQRNRGLG